MNARLTKEVEKQFVYLQEHLDLSQSEIVKEKISQFENLLLPE